MSQYKVLFVCKKFVNSYGVPFGLVNSSRMMAEILNINDIDSKVVTVIDSNGIDKQVHDYNPTHVVINAIWTPPEKIKVLCKKYPGTSWNIRIHSKPPFLAMEGIASEWIADYVHVQKGFNNLWLSANSYETFLLLSEVFKSQSLMLPNTYVKPGNPIKPLHNPVIIDGMFNVACFGAIRPLKNQYAQAVAAIMFANKNHLKLAFHINSGRDEQGGDQVMKNLVQLFDACPRHKLVIHPWYTQDVLVHNVLPQMDLGMQISLTETFDIVAADMVAAGIPMVGSPDVYWMEEKFRADPNNLNDMVEKIELVKGKGKRGVKINKDGLDKTNDEAVSIWKKGLIETHMGDASSLL
jgi:hypothetical protein